MMNLLVTGGAGFIGAHFVKHALRQGEVAKLVNLDCLTYAGDLGRLEGVAKDARYVFEKVDLRDAGEVGRVVREHAVTHVVHLAAETHVDRSIADPRAFIDTNVTGTFHLLEACRGAWRAGGRERFVQVSTDEVYGSLEPEEPPFMEESPLRPNSPYAASKAAADCLVRSYGKTYGLPVIITRCTNNFGPGQHEEKLIPTVIRCLRERRPIPIYGDGRNVRDWLPVEDHVEALWLALVKGEPGEIYNIGASQERSNLDLAARLCAIYDRSHGGQRSGSAELITLIADRPGHDRRYAVTAAKAERAWGWHPRVAFDERLGETVAWFEGGRQG